MGPERLARELMARIPNYPRRHSLSHAGPSKHHAAQGLVEFGLILPILMLLIVGAIEFGRLMFVISAVTTASREAARYGFSSGENSFGIPHYQDCDGIRAAASRTGSIAGIEAPDVTIEFDNGPGTGAYASCPPASVNEGDRIVITVTADFDAMIPFVDLPEFPISSTARRTLMLDVEVY